ncbi:MAG: hypothetical protein UV17_C0019G0036 [Candidatus Gottesmanbacteria bacterium GW2011_GWA1_42_26]|nr:MAG: hypothetical protein UV17_C0019G0036 [Candidatus Gottesmanbacteria bacterium GW2011_GWA1_42_26]
MEICYSELMDVKLELHNYHIDVLVDLFTNLAAGFMASLLIFPGIFGVETNDDFLALLLINLPSAILCLYTAFKLKKYNYA